MSSCNVALMSTRHTGYKMPGSTYQTHYSPTSRSYGSSYDTTWKNYGSSSVRPLTSRTSSYISDYKPSYLSLPRSPRSSSVSIAIQSGLLTHNLGSKYSYPSIIARETREGSESLSVNSSSRLLKQTNEPSVNGYVKYLGGRHSNTSNSTSVGDVSKYSPKFHKYNLTNLPLTTSVGKPPLRSVSSSLLELERPSPRRSSGAFTSSKNNFSQFDSLSDYHERNSSPSLGNSTARMAVEGKYSTQSCLDGQSTAPGSSPHKEHRALARHRESLSMEKTQEGGLRGLLNIGNTCFLNSVVQCLSHTKELHEFLWKDGYLSEINYSSSMRGGLVKAFSELIKELWQTETSNLTINPTAFKSQIQRFASRFVGSNQQDAQEFLRYLLEGLHEDVNRVKVKPQRNVMDCDEKLSSYEKSAAAWKAYLRRDNSKIVDLFVGQLKSTLSCTNCKNNSITYDPFWDLSLPITEKRGTVDIAQCLDLFTKEEILDGDERPECSVCKGRQRSTKRFSIQKFPKILVLHLKRFSSHQESSIRGKINFKVEFPIKGLDLRAYSSSAVNCSYNLYGVVYHSGTTRSGHYISRCKHPYTQKWYEFNDVRVSPTMGSNIVSSDAYLLFYEMA